MAEHALNTRPVSIRLACQAFRVSQACDRYAPAMRDQNQEIADWLMRLTGTYRTWGFGRCFLYLRDVKGDFNREALGIEVDFSLAAGRVVPTLDQIVDWRGKPASIRCDNGPEYLSRALTEWANAKEIKLAYIQPGQPQQNAYIERFNRTARYEWPAQFAWDDLSQVQNAQPRNGCGFTITNAHIGHWAD